MGMIVPDEYLKRMPLAVVSGAQGAKEAWSMAGTVKDALHQIGAKRESGELMYWMKDFSSSWEMTVQLCALHAGFLDTNEADAWDLSDKAQLARSGQASVPFLGFSPTSAQLQDPQALSGRNFMGRGWAHYLRVKPGASERSLAAVEQMVRAAPEAMAPDRMGMTPLHWSSSLEVVEGILRALGPDTSAALAGSKDIFGNSAAACQFALWNFDRSPGRVRVILALAPLACDHEGFDPKSTPPDGFTALNTLMYQREARDPNAYGASKETPADQRSRHEAAAAFLLAFASMGERAPQWARWGRSILEAPSLGDAARGIDDPKVRKNFQRVIDGRLKANASYEMGKPWKQALAQAEALDLSTSIKAHAGSLPAPAPGASGPRL